MDSLALDETLGAAFLGMLIFRSFYGITVVQTYIYFKRSAKDSAFLKVLDSLHLALIVHSIYYYAVTNFMNPKVLASPTWSILGVSDVTVRSIFCHRVWRLSNGNWPLAIAIMVSSLTVFGESVYASEVGQLQSFGVGTFAGFSKIADILYVSFGAGVVADVLIAGALCTILARCKTGFRKTDSVVRTLIMYSINTGLLTSLCALSCLITYATMPNNFIFIAFYFVLPKLFLNSLLATLNAREALRDAGAGDVVSIPLTNTSGSTRMSFVERSQYIHGDSALSGGIHIKTTTDTMTDPQQSVNVHEKKGVSGWRSSYSASRRPGGLA
ncbi:hypothetical protein BD311DRAFT_672889 [Dichomitus squalens]|uniref:DUF6534 domain-containing protein n=1 Tax=Dichomitus squalens TaxID=114155 RepID=A0A4Q9MBV0_9APHY|nr:hypothetical protein BD311DRAFT_672889 [Dichomitus squalens]